MIKKILLGLAAGLLLFMGYVAILPAEYLISRELVINAPAEVIFPLINNSKKASEWMPWTKLDPQAQMKFSGPDEGVGSASSWDSPGQMGTGSATVVESVPQKSVKTKLIYTKPFQGEQLAEVAIIPGSGGQTVKWSVQGTNHFFARLMCTIMNMDKMVGGHFEEGLAQLKATAESSKSN